MDVGLIGLGKVGSGIAKTLLRSGHHLTVYNRTHARAEALRADGATVAHSIADACHGPVVFTMLADDSAVESAAFSDHGILASLGRGAVHISLSTISVALSDKLAANHARAGQEYIAAPVFGRPEAAESAKLAVVAAGSRSALDRCKPLLESLGPKLLILGDHASQANVVKLSGNFLIATVLESLGEAIAFARKSGVDPATLLDFLTGTLFNAPVYKSYGAMIVEGKHDEVGFALPLGLKDVRLVLQAAEAQNVPMPFASVLRDRFLTAIARGNEHRDWSVVAQMAAQDSGLTPPTNAKSAKT
ncbi:MAG TPA: NAD(P)-dependent oxidoreductase [Candidatus Acidoferrum sp.]|jgi:3-hydroxyisobutyrate dehydrogenase-like beta-hydroxyacid dehydrogenase